MKKKITYAQNLKERVSNVKFLKAIKESGENVQLNGIQEELLKDEDEKELEIEI